MDATENFRKVMVSTLASEVESTDEQKERDRLEKAYGQVWDTKELQADFTVKGFMAPYVAVVRKKDMKKGTLIFQHMPRFYFMFDAGSSGA